MREWKYLAVGVKTDMSLIPNLATYSVGGFRKVL